MPVLVRGQGLDETGAFLRRLAFGAADQSGRFEHPIRRRRSHRGHVRIQHHEGQAAVAFQRVLEDVADDSLFFLWLQPMVARHLRVVVIGLAVASAPPGKFPGAECQPRQEAAKGEFGAGVHAFEEVHHGIAFVRGSPLLFSVLPKFFFFARQFLSHCGDDFTLFPQPGLKVFYFGSARINFPGAGRAVESRRSVLKEGFLPLVEEGGMDLVGIADGGDGLSLNEVQAQEPDFFLCGILTADPGGGVLVLSLVFHGWTGLPAAACLIRSNRHSV